MRRKFFDSSLQLGFPNNVVSVENKILFTLWREGSQCVANIGVLTGVDPSEVSSAVTRLRQSGKVQVAGEQDSPFSVCSLGVRASAKVQT